MIWQGSPKAVLVGAPGEQWHKALLVSYPSKQAFVEMVGSAEYQAVAVHRTAALEDYATDRDRAGPIEPFGVRTEAGCCRKGARAASVDVPVAGAEDR